MTFPTDLDRRDFCKAGMATAASVAVSGLITTSAHAATFELDELCYMSAAELLPLFKARKLSPVEVLKAQIARYKAVNEMVNCVTYTHFDSAMKRATESEKRWRNGTARALEGITCGIKDEHHDVGWIVTQGSEILKDDRKDYAHSIMIKLKHAGVVPHIQTTVPEFYLNSVTWTKLWGVSRCPWNLKYAVGGSSGGSGACLAAGMATIATGSDMGGSVRLPCAFNGLYGFKPPFGRVATELPLSYFSGTGPLARTFADMTMMQNVISGQTPHEPATLPKLRMPLNYRGVKGLRIAYSPGMGLAPIDKETKEAMADAIEVLRGQGATVDEIEIDPGFSGEEVGEVFSKGALGGAMGGMFAEFDDQLDEMTSYGAYFVEKAASGKYGPATVNEFEGIVKQFYARLSDAVFRKGYAALIMPTQPTAHIPADYDFTKGGYELDGQQMHPFSPMAFTIPWNLLNWCPVVAAPTALSSQGMPMSMQIVGKPYDDLRVFQIAHAYESAAIPLFRGKRMPDFRK
jgi:amidase